MKLIKLILLISASTATALAEDLPKWEIGLGFGALHQSYYTGTKQTRDFIFPVPLLVYRGDTLKSDDEGFRAELFKDERYKFDFSFDFNLAIESDEIDLRQGMDDINSVLQVGPSIELTLNKTKSRHIKIDFPIRAAFEIGSGEVDEAGYNFSPRLAYTHYSNTGLWRTSLSLAPQFGTGAYHDVYYSVNANEVTATRAEYEAASGYSGSRVQLALTSKNKKRLIVLFARYDNLNGAVFEDSPLVETDENLTLGFIYSHYFFKSKTMVGNN